MKYFTIMDQFPPKISQRLLQGYIVIFYYYLNSYYIHYYKV